MGDASTMTERAYQFIRAGLADGVFKPGSKLSEGVIAKEIKVGRTPVREALLLLANEGFIEQLPRYGTFVRKASRHERQSLFELREQLESYAAGKAARFMSPTQVDKLGELCDILHQAITQLGETKNVESPPDDILSRIAITDMTFHMLILRASGNPFVIKSVGDLHLMSRIWSGDRSYLYNKSLGDWAKNWQEHLRIYRAIRRGDADAATNQMRLHIQKATVTALEAYDLQCRNEGVAGTAGEWPEAVRDAISRMEQAGQNGIE